MFKATESAPPVAFRPSCSNSALWLRWVLWFLYTALPVPSTAA